ncbi:MAG TPA: PIN domain-containing protein [Candidatus Xenobia bacterium]
MTLSDASALIAIVDPRDHHHGRSRQAVRRLSKPLVTTWPCWTEALHRAYSIGAWHAQKVLWGLIQTETLRLYSIDQAEGRLLALMEKYRDTPMDLGDASLVVAAEVLGLTRIFTFDSDFQVYRIYDRTPFEVVP